MRLSLRASVLILTCGSVAAAQTKAQETPPKTREAPKAQEPAPAPPAPQTTVAAATGAATTTATVTDSKVAEAGHSPVAPMAPGAPVAGHRVASPKEVKNLYIEPMVDELDLYLRAEFAKQLAGRIVIVSKPEDADAVMTGIGEWGNGTEHAVTRSTSQAHDTVRGAVQVLSKDSLLWASEAWGHMKSGGQRKVASRIVHNFKNVIEGQTEEDAYSPVAPRPTP